MIKKKDLLQKINWLEADIKMLKCSHEKIDYRVVAASSKSKPGEALYGKFCECGQTFPPVITESEMLTEQLKDLEEKRAVIEAQLSKQMETGWYRISDEEKKAFVEPLKCEVTP